MMEPDVLAAAIKELSARIAGLGPVPGPPPAASMFHSPYLNAGHSPLNAAPARTPAIPVNTPAGTATVGEMPHTRISGQPATLAPQRVDVPTGRTGNPLSALDTPPPGGVYVNRLDLAGAASPRMAAHLGKRAPSGVPVRPFDSFTAASGYGQGGAR